MSCRTEERLFLLVDIVGLILVVYCTTLCVLHCSVLCCTVLCFTVLCCIKLYYTALLCHLVLRCTAPY
jgi:hypothetical protein